MVLDRRVSDHRIRTRWLDDKIDAFVSQNILESPEDSLSDPRVRVRPSAHVRVRAWVCGCVGVWVCGCVGVWVSGCLGVWVHGCLGAWVHGCLSAWVSGCMGAWVHGCLGAWARARVPLHACCIMTCLLCVHLLPGDAP